MISIIVAIATNGVIGGDNKLLWHISEDLKNFKRITLGHPMIMGRKTFESFPKALPNRQNIVITRNPAYTANGADVVLSLADALKVASPKDEIFIIGGGDIYRQAMPLADKLYITHVDLSPQGDTTFPDISSDEWREVLREPHQGYTFTEYLRCK